MLGLQEPKGGFKLYLLFETEQQWLKALHLPGQVATRATVVDVVEVLGVVHFQNLLLSNFFGLTGFPI